LDSYVGVEPAHEEAVKIYELCDTVTRELRDLQIRMGIPDRIAVGISEK
jgi:hypothetical protein